MDDNDRRRNIAIIAGVLLVLAGLWFIVVRVAAPLFEPLRVVLGFVWSIGWPLALVALGILLIVRRDSLHGPGSLEGKRLYRSRNDRMLGGVFGGLGVYLGVDATLLRIGFALLAIVTWFVPAVVAYVIAMVIMPEEPFGQVNGSSAPAAPPIPPPPAS